MLTHSLSFYERYRTMSRRKVKVFALIGVIATLFTMTAAAQLDSVLKGGGIAFLVSRFGPDINKALNKLTKTNTAGTPFDTKVVPVLSAGTGTYAGAVQVAGPREAVRKVQ